MMKTIFGIMIAMIFFLSSCAISSKRVSLSNHERYLLIFQLFESGSPFQEYLLLKPQEKTYDHYATWSQGGVMGHYEERVDTVTLIPEYRYGSTIRAMSDEDKENMFPKDFIKREKELIDITDYSDPDSLVNTYLQTFRGMYNFKLID